MGNFGKHIRELRTAKGMTQEQLAEQIHVTKQSVSKWEQNKSLPDITLLELLANYFEISVDDLLHCAEKNGDCRQEDMANDKLESSISNLTRQNKILKIISLVLSVVIVGLSVCVGILTAGRSPKAFKIQDTEIKVIETRCEDRYAIVTLSIYNATDSKRDYPISNFSLQPSTHNITIAYLYQGSTYFPPRQPITIDLKLLSKDGFWKDLGITSVTLKYLDIEIAKVKTQ